MNECPIPSVQPRFYICLRYSFILNNKMMVLIVKMVTKSRIYTNEIKCKWCTAYKIEHNKWNISFQFIQCPFALCCSIIIYENVCQRRQPITFKLKEVCSMSFFWCLLCCCCCGILKARTWIQNFKQLAKEKIMLGRLNVSKLKFYDLKCATIEIHKEKVVIVAPKS